MKGLTKILLAAGVLAVGGTAMAEPYVDYTPQKGYWDINAIEVDLKKRGIIDDYQFLVRNGYVKGSPNVLIMTHSPDVSSLDPDQARDQAIEKEMLAQFSKDAGDKAVAGYEKYRTFIDNAQWGVVVMKK